MIIGALITAEWLCEVERDGAVVERISLLALATTVLYRADVRQASARQGTEVSMAKICILGEPAPLSARTAFKVGQIRYGVYIKL